MSDLPRTASTVVVGGGIVGAAAAFFLADRGETDVLLLEREHLGAGTTGGGLGGIRHQFVDELDVRLSLLASAFWREYDSFTGGSHEFQQRGYLFIATSADGMRELRAPLPLYEGSALPSRWSPRIASRVSSRASAPTTSPADASAPRTGTATPRRRSPVSRPRPCSGGVSIRRGRGGSRRSSARAIASPACGSAGSR